MEPGDSDQVIHWGALEQGRSVQVLQGVAPGTSDEVTQGEEPGGSKLVTIFKLIIPALQNVLTACCTIV